MPLTTAAITPAPSLKPYFEFSPIEHHKIAKWGYDANKGIFGVVFHAKPEVVVTFSNYKPRAMAFVLERITSEGFEAGYEQMRRDQFDDNLAPEDRVRYDSVLMGVFYSELYGHVERLRRGLHALQAEALI